MAESYTTTDCCDPCLHLRGGGNHYLRALQTHIEGGVPDPGADCCRCVPRAVVFKLTPEDYSYSCCYQQTLTVHPILENLGGWLKVVYRSNAFGYTFELSLGRFSKYLDDSGHEDYAAYDFDAYDYCDDYDPYAIGYCAWRLRVYNVTGTLLSSTIYPLADSDDCLTPPSVEYGPITYPPGCGQDSYVSFEAFSKEQLAYISASNPDIDEYSLFDLCPSDCGGTTPTCVSVQTDGKVVEYSQIADIDYYPAWSDGTNTIYWDTYELVWIMIDGSSTELARGGEDSSCPLGVWTSSLSYDDYDVFCVSLCDSGGYETEVSFVCGDCTRATQYVCVSGNWRGNGWEFLNFEWTKELSVEGTYPNTYTTLKQGWMYTDPVTDDIEYLWLVDNGTDCVLTPEFSVNNISSQTITSGCGCELFEESHSQPWPGDFYWYSVHSGYCTEFDFYCGSCRCVPPLLCVTYSLDGSSTTQAQLSWDATSKQWGDDYTDTVTIHLEADTDTGECLLVVYYEGSPLSLWVDDVQTAIEESYDCQQELFPAHTDDDWDHPLGLPSKEGVRLTRRTKCRNSYSDWIGFTVEGYINRYTDFLQISVNSSQSEDCEMIVCDSFFYDNCSSACVDQPKKLSGTLSVRNANYGTGYDEQTWTLTAELSLVVQHQGGFPPTYYCAYVGTYVKDCTLSGQTVTEAWTIELQEAGFSVTIRYWEDVSGTLTLKTSTHSFAATIPTVSCSPIYAETDYEELNIAAIAPGLLCTWGLSEDERPFEMKLTVSEASE